MKKLAMTLTAAAVLLGPLAITANAQTQSLGASNFRAQIKNATPIIKQIACNGTTGSHGCGPGFVWSGRFHRCVPC